MIRLKSSVVSSGVKLIFCWLIVVFVRRVLFECSAFIVSKDGKSSCVACVFMNDLLEFTGIPHDGVYLTYGLD